MATDYVARLRPLLREVEQRGATVTKAHGHTHYVLGKVKFSIPTAAQVSSKSFQQSKDTIAQAIRRYDDHQRKLHRQQRQLTLEPEVEITMAHDASQRVGREVPPPPPPIIEPVLPPVTEPKRAPMMHDTPDLACRVGCGRMFSWPPGRGKHEKKCRELAGTKALDAAPPPPPLPPVRRRQPPVFDGALVAAARTSAAVSNNGRAKDIKDVVEEIKFLLGARPPREAVALLDSLPGMVGNLEAEVRLNRQEHTRMQTALEQITAIVGASRPTRMDRLLAS